MQLSPKDQERNIAYHEAGHAVFDYELGWPVDSVSIIPDKNYAGIASMSDAAAVELEFALAAANMGPAGILACAEAEAAGVDLANNKYENYIDRPQDEYPKHRFDNFSNDELDKACEEHLKQFNLYCQGLLAGYLAPHLFLGSELPDASSYMGERPEGNDERNDYRGFFETWERLNQEDMTEFYETQDTQARQLLKHKYAKAVTALADALIEKREITGEEAFALISSTLAGEPD